MASPDVADDANSNMHDQRLRTRSLRPRSRSRSATRTQHNETTHQRDIDSSPDHNQHTQTAATPIHTHNSVSRRSEARRATTTSRNHNDFTRNNTNNNNNDNEEGPLATLRATYAREKTQVAWLRNPRIVLRLLVARVMEDVVANARAVLAYRTACAAATTCAAALAAACLIDSAARAPARAVVDSAAWLAQWLLLGVASSVGLGSGLHTFVLFLAPHVFRVARAVQTCKSTRFATRGTHSFVCEGAGTHSPEDVSVWRVYSLVAVEVLAWGLGTALGELPPYFMARAAARAGCDDPDVRTIEQVKAKPRAQQTIFERVQLLMLRIVEELGFVGIVLCASIPNPLFDVAGILCGHFGVAFATFFGATVAGKMLVKANVQALAVILIARPDLVDWVVASLDRAPRLQRLAARVLAGVGDRYGSTPASIVPPTTDTSSMEAPRSLATLLRTVVQHAWGGIVFGMLAVFLLSAAQALARAQLRRSFQRDETRLLRSR